MLSSLTFPFSIHFWLHSPLSKPVEGAQGSGTPINNFAGFLIPKKSVIWEKNPNSTQEQGGLLILQSTRGGSTRSQTPPEPQQLQRSGGINHPKTGSKQHISLFLNQKKITCTQLCHQFHQGIPLEEQEGGREPRNPFMATSRLEFAMSVLILILTLIILILVYLTGFPGFGSSQGTRKPWESAKSWVF